MSATRRAPERVFALVRCECQSLAHLQHRPRIDPRKARTERSHRSLHSSSPACARSRPAYRSQYRSITKAELDRIAAARAELFAQYTPEQRESLKQLYTPEQLKAIEAGEEAVSAEDLVTQGRLRTERLGIQYAEEEWTTLGRLQPAIDKKLSRIQEEKAGNVYEDQVAEMRQAREEFLDYDPELLGPLGEKQLEYDVLVEQLTGVMRRQQNTVSGGEDSAKTTTSSESVPLEPEFADVERWRRIFNIPTEPAVEPTPAEVEALRRIVPPESPRHIDYSGTVAPTIPKLQDPMMRMAASTESSDARQDEAEDEEIAEARARVSKMTGLSLAEIKRIRPKALYMRSVTNQTRMGKINSIYYIALAGNGNGMVGIGEGKAYEHEDAQMVAELNAIRNMRPIRRYENRTIYGQIKGKVGAAEVTLSARPPGFGLRCSQYIFEIARAAGLQDLSAKVTRSRNPMNVCKAVWQALQDQPDPEEIAKARGKKLVDVRKVYYSGLV